MIKKLVLMSLLLFQVSCVSRKAYEKELERNKLLTERLLVISVLEDEIQKLKFQLSDSKFRLDSCQRKLKQQDFKLIECIERDNND